MLRLRALVPALAVLAALGLAACTPGTGVATPTPTVLSEDEAYAQAETAFRAYIDAQNEIVVSDPSTFEPFYALSTGDQSSFDRKLYSRLHAEGWTVTGAERIVLLEPAETSATTVGLDVCLDVSDVKSVDSSGQSTIAADRPPVQSLSVDVSRTISGWLVSRVSGREGDPECS